MRFSLSGGVLACALALGAEPPENAQSAGKLARAYADSVESVNEAHARKPGTNDEDALEGKVPKSARKGLKKLVQLDAEADGIGAALELAAEAALDLALLDDFELLRERLAEVDPALAAQVGTAHETERFLLRGIGELDEAYLVHFAGVLDAVLDGYEELFGPWEWSKVPGKKLRVRVHLEEKITRPPHFAPQFPYHSEIDFPIVDPKELSSPTSDGKFLFYGLCHELGHVIAMWGDRENEEDHHTWAHYTGVLLVEHLSQEKALAGNLRDVRWRSLEKERELHAETAPDPATKEGTMALWIALHDELGPRALGDAIRWLQEDSRTLRIHHVRYYGFADLERALQKTCKSKAKLRRLRELFGA